jgi:hypothetical protein
MVGTEVATGAPVQTLRPHPVTTDDTGVFDTSRGTVHLVLGCGGTNANLDDYGVDQADGLPQAKVFTRGTTSITVTQYHALGADPVNPATGEAGAPTPDYTAFETFTLVRPRSDRPGRSGRSGRSGRGASTAEKSQVTA